MGRTPYLAQVIGDFVEKTDILAFMEAVLRVYNEQGRRDNIYKARIKILTNSLGIAEMRRQVEIEFAEIKARGALEVPQAEIDRITAYFAPPAFETGLSDDMPDAGTDFANWVKTIVARHKQSGYAIATITLKTPGQVPGDATAEQMEVIADLMDEFSVGVVRVTHEQNMVLPHVRKTDLPAIFARLKELDFATPNAGLITDIIACPGLDYCDLANARSIPIAQKIAKRFEKLERQQGDRRAEDQDQRLHQCLRPPSCRPYRHPGRRQEGRGILPAGAGRFGCRGRLHRHHHGPGLWRA